MDRVTEEYSSGIETEEVQLPSAFHVKNVEPDVCLFCDVTCAYVCMCVGLCVIMQVIYNVIFTSEIAHTIFTCTCRIFLHLKQLQRNLISWLCIFALMICVVAWQCESRMKQHFVNWIVYSYSVSVYIVKYIVMPRNRNAFWNLEKLGFQQLSVTANQEALLIVLCHGFREESKIAERSVLFVYRGTSDNLC